jgi:hypothetical protein
MELTAHHADCVNSQFGRLPVGAIVKESGTGALHRQEGAFRRDAFLGQPVDAQKVTLAG